MLLLDVPDEKLLSLANDIPEPKPSEILPATKKIVGSDRIEVSAALVEPG